MSSMSTAEKRNSAMTAALAHQKNGSADFSSPSLSGGGNNNSYMPSIGENSSTLSSSTSSSIPISSPSPSTPNSSVSSFQHPNGNGHQSISINVNNNSPPTSSISSRPSLPMGISLPLTAHNGSLISNSAAISAILAANNPSSSSSSSVSHTGGSVHYQSNNVKPGLSHSLSLSTPSTHTPKRVSIHDPLPIMSVGGISPPPINIIRNSLNHSPTMSSTQPSTGSPKNSSINNSPPSSSSSSSSSPPPLPLGTVAVRNSRAPPPLSQSVLEKLSLQQKNISMDDPNSASSSSSSLSSSSSSASSSASDSSKPSGFRGKRPLGLSTISTPRSSTSSPASHQNSGEEFMGLSIPLSDQPPPSPIGSPNLSRRNSDPKVDHNDDENGNALNPSDSFHSRNDSGGSKVFTQLTRAHASGSISGPLPLIDSHASPSRHSSGSIDNSSDRKSTLSIHYAPIIIPKYRSHDWSRASCCLKIKRTALVSPAIQALLPLTDGRIACCTPSAIRVYTLPSDSEPENIGGNSSNYKDEGLRSPQLSPRPHDSPNHSPHFSPASSPRALGSMSVNPAARKSGVSATKAGVELDGSDKSLREVRLPGSVSKPCVLPENRIAISLVDHTEIWKVNLNGGERVSELAGHDESTAEILATLPDGKLASVGKDYMLIMNPRVQKVERTLKGNHLGVTVIPSIPAPPNPPEKSECPIPVGHSAPYWLASVREGRVRLWDTTTGLNIADICEACIAIDCLKVSATAAEQWDKQDKEKENQGRDGKSPSPTPLSLGPSLSPTSSPSSSLSSSASSSSSSSSPSSSSAVVSSPPTVFNFPVTPAELKYSLVTKPPPPARFLVTLKERYFKVWRISWEPYQPPKEKKGRKGKRSSSAAQANTATGEPATPLPPKNDDSPKPINEANPPAFQLLAREVCCIYKMSEFGYSSILSLQDGRLAVGTRDGAVRVFSFDVITESLKQEAAWVAHTGSKRFVEHICELPDGRLVTAVGSQKNRSMKIWTDHGIPATPAPSKDCVIM